MTFVWYILFFIIGYVLYSFSFIQILLTLFCALPVTKLLKQKGAIEDNSLNKMNIFTIVVHFILNAVVITIIILFARNNMIIGFFIGFLVAFLASLRKLGRTDDNVNDYINTYQHRINMDIVNNLDLNNSNHETNRFRQRYSDSQLYKLEGIIVDEISKMISVNQNNSANLNLVDLFNNVGKRVTSKLNSANNTQSRLDSYLLPMKIAQCPDINMDHIKIEDIFSCWGYVLTDRKILENDKEIFKYVVFSKFGELIPNGV